MDIDVDEIGSEGLSIRNTTMKNIFILLLSIFLLPASAAVPLKWYVETSLVSPATARGAKKFFSKWI